MKTKNINVVVEEVKVIAFTIDLGNELAKYQSRFLALKNHERETEEIVEVRNFYGSNKVRVTYLLEDEEYECLTEQVERCKEHVEQFGEIVSQSEIETAYTLDCGELSMMRNKIDYKELYLIH